MNSKRIIGFVVAWPITSLTAFALVGIALAAGETYRVISDVSYKTAVEAAVSYSAAINSIRAYYSSEVVPRAKAAGANISHEFRDVEGAIPLPATLTIELGEIASGLRSGGEFRLFSSYPFPWRPDGGARDEFEIAMLDALVEEGNEEFIAIEDVGSSRFLRYAIPVRMNQSCVDCHNNHTSSPRKDWREGDVRGVQSVRLPMPSLSFPASFSQFGTFVFMFGGLLGGLLLFGLLLRHLQRALKAEQRLLELAERRNHELSDAKTAAEAANRSKSEFLANMSHELRTPLNAVIGFAEIMKNEMFGPLGEPRYAGYAQDIHASGGHLLEIITDLLDISKLETGRLVLDESSLLVDELIENCLSLVRERADAANVHLSAAVEQDLPCLFADGRLMKQILINLLSNAVKFTPEGGRVTVRAYREDGGALALSVTDTGIGIKEEDRSRIFEPFVQVDSSLARQYAGTGLGLPLVQKFAKLHGASLNLRSELGSGTSVTVRIPSERLESEATRSEPSAA